VILLFEVTTSQPSYLCGMISVNFVPTLRNAGVSVITFARLRTICFWNRLSVGFFSVLKLNLRHFYLILFISGVATAPADPAMRGRRVKGALRHWEKKL